MSERLTEKPMARCQICGEPVAHMWANHDDPPDPRYIVIRCFQCAAVEEAEAITAQPPEGESE